ncbi:MAG: type II toxin-antitoxin system RelE/ParE family toxin, partial [Chloroflexota bacterium]
MPWSLNFARRAERDLADLPERLRDEILAVARQAAVDPSSVSLAKLKGRPGEWRIRVSAWRIIVVLDTRAGTMTVLRVLPR